MTHSVATTGFKDELTDRVFERFRQYTKQVTGINLPDGHKSMLISRVSSRMRHLKIERYEQYLDFLVRHDSNEQQLFVNAMTTNLTAFFRENHHFEYLAQSLLPELVQKKRRIGKKIRVWSAGCSTGEEAYSIAMVLHESMSDLANWDCRILATDLDTNALDKAKAGIYQRGGDDQLSAERMKRWFLSGKGKQEGYMKVRPELSRLIAFRHLNLLGAWPMKGGFDFIFCRNVIIYFDLPTRATLVKRFAERLPTGGHLFIGHSENLISKTHHFKLLDKTIYHKT